jgi:hypothetical protein
LETCNINTLQSIFCRVELNSRFAGIIMAIAVLERVKRIQSSAAANDADPWRMKLERLRGTIGGDGVERIAARAIFDHLGIPGRKRSGDVNKRLAKHMNDLGWTTTTVRALTGAGFKERVRGYARAQTTSTAALRFQ